jgi:perosamine synthetase
LIHIAMPIIEEEEITAVNAVLHSGILAQGPKVAELEAAFADYCGTKYAAAVSSGTAALHASLFAAGVGLGDEVITTPFSFIATINPILMLGAKPVLVDIDPQTFNIDPKLVAAAITPRTKVIMPVHLYGQPCDAGPIAELAEEHGIKIIEDACQAIGASYKGKKTGDLGDLGCFSLYATKNIMCGEGGMVVTNDENYLNAIKRFRQHGMSGPYQYESLGYNYRLTDLQAAIAAEQLKKVDRFNAQRQHNAQYLDQHLKNIKGISLPVVASDRTHVYHQYTLRVSPGFSLKRDEFVEALRSHEVGAGVYYPLPLHVIPHISAQGYAYGDFPEAEKAANEVVSLPIHPKVSQQDLETIVAVVRELASV